MFDIKLMSYYLLFVVIWFFFDLAENHIHKKDDRAFRTSCREHSATDIVQTFEEFVGLCYLSHNYDFVRNVVIY